jgi:hypothetical protein
LPAATSAGGFGSRRIVQPLSSELQAIPLPEISFHFTISYRKSRALSGAKGGQSYAHLFGTSREIEMERKSAAPLKQITDRGIDEVQRAGDFQRPGEVVDLGGFYFIVAQVRPN